MGCARLPFYSKMCLMLLGKDRLSFVSFWEGLSKDIAGHRKG